MTKPIGVPARSASPAAATFGAGGDHRRVAAEAGAERERPPVGVVAVGTAGARSTTGIIAVVNGMLSTIAEPSAGDPEDPEQLRRCGRRR